MKAIRAMGRSLAWLIVALAVFAAAWVGVNVLRADAAEGGPQESLAPATGRWIDAGDVRMFVQQWGPPDGPVIVLAHGTGAWSGTWFGTPAFLAARGWRVVAVDLPPFGFTQAIGPAPAELDYRRAAQAQRLLAVLHAVTNEPVVLLGHSFGSGPALETAMREPARVRQLVLVDPALGLDPDGTMPACSGTAASWPMNSRAVRTALVKSTATVPPLTGPLLKTFVHRKDVVTADKLVDYRKPFRRSGFSAQLGDWAATFATRDCEGAISTDAAAVAAWARQARLALIWGAEDTITPPAQGVALGRLTGTTPTFIANVGHIPHIEDPDRFHQVLGQVLKMAP
jgi:pimeloyl-ACP methyl ester carboxylesterase